MTAVRVLFVGLDVYSGEGGIARYCRRLVRALAEGGAETTVLSLWDAPEDGFRAPPAVRFAGCGRSKARLLSAYAAALRRDRPDVVIFGHVLLAPLALWGRRRPSLLMTYGVDAWRRPGPLARAAVRRIGRIVAISETTAGRAATAFGVPRDRFVLLPPAVEGPGAPGAPPRDPGEDHRVVCVSRLSRADAYKGVDDLVRAARLLAFGFPDAHVMVAGDGDLRPDLERLAAEIGVTDRVHFLGWLPDEQLDALYASADCFALPSSGEGFGIVYLEAWRHGVPVVAAGAGATVEVVRDGETGVLVPPGDPVALAGAIGGLLQDPDRRRALGEAGRRLVAERYGHARFREALDEILAEVTGSCVVSPAR